MKTDKNSTAGLASSDGFSILETIVAMLIIMIAMLGALQVINYSEIYNAGNASRAQSLAILQQEAERVRSAKFTPTGVDSAAPSASGVCRVDAQRDITGGTKTPCRVLSPNGGSYRVSTFVDDNPFNASGTYDVDAATRIKEITLEVRLDSPTPGWQTAVPARLHVFGRRSG